MASTSSSRSAQKINISGLVSEHIQPKTYKEYNWEGSFQEYVDLVRAEPAITRNAFQRMYDMILGYGSENFTDFKKNLESEELANNNNIPIYRKYYYENGNKKSNIY